MINEGMMSSDYHGWETDPSLVSYLGEVFDWDMDVCAESNNICDTFITKEEDGLSQEWRGLCWMNPPYGRQIGSWIKKAMSSTKATVVCLVPARTDTKWWHEAIRLASCVVFIKGRLKFGNAKSSAPFPSAIIVYGDISTEQVSCLKSLGWMVA